MAKVLPLEGPHKKHHDHGKDASVPDGTTIVNEHWERHYAMHPKPSPINPATAFDAHRGKNRPCTHEKVNELDH